MSKIEEWELWACANAYIQKFGTDGPLEAASRADELLAEGDTLGASTFSEIASRAEQLLRKPGGRLH